MATNPSANRDDPAYRWGATVMLLAVATIATAFGFEHIGGYAPCPLCLQQRWAYFFGIPASFLALVLLAIGRPRAAALVFFAVAMAFLANSGLGVYHAGAEWKFWPGPTTCASAAQPLGGAGGGVLGSLATTSVIRCDEAPWRFAGLSFGGWNAVVSLVLFILALQAAFSSSARYEPDLSFRTTA